MFLGEPSALSQRLDATPGLRLALDFVQRPDLSSLPEGRTEVDDDRVFALVQRYRSERLEQPLLEYHRRHVDVQAVVEGAEALLWAPAASLRVTQAYDPERDAALGQAPPLAVARLPLRPGLVAVFFPEDGHAGRLALDAPCAVTKVVIKVAVAPT